MGRVGRLARPLAVETLVRRIKKATGVANVLLARRRGRSCRAKVTVAACCAGSCGSMFRAALAAGATFYLTGEMRHHDALAAAAAGMTVVCVGHSNSERPALERLADKLRGELGGLKVTLSRADRDPFEIH